MSTPQRLFDLDHLEMEGDPESAPTAITAAQPTRPTTTTTEPAPAVEISAVEIDVRVIRSDKRRRTVSARMVKGVMELRIPARLSRAEEQHWITEMRGRFARKRATEEIDLMERSRDLAAKHDLPVPATIRWVSNQESCWGSCTPVDRSIRISDKLMKTPLWVLDYVIVHELAHLRHGNHGPSFWKLVERYPRTERARGYLEALGMSDEMADE